jgi:hypothetical protein
MTGASLPRQKANENWMNLWHDITLGPRPPEKIHMIVEIPSNTRNKHKFDRMRQCKQQAEAIMDGGRSNEYDSTVSWLSVARDIYAQHERQQEWETYLNSLLDTHFRKYKLVPMLRSIGK